MEDIINLKPEDIDYEKPFIGSGLQNLEAEQCARALISRLVLCNKTFRDTFTLKDMGNITSEQLYPLIERNCVIRNPSGVFEVTPKFLKIVSEFKKK